MRKRTRTNEEIAAARAAAERRRQLADERLEREVIEPERRRRREQRQQQQAAAARVREVASRGRPTSWGRVFEPFPEQHESPMKRRWRASLPEEHRRALDDYGTAVEHYHRTLAGWNRLDPAVSDADVDEAYARCQFAATRIAAARRQARS